jgi:hypothetical protein
MNKLGVFRNSSFYFTASTIGIPLLACVLHRYCNCTIINSRAGQQDFLSHERNDNGFRIMSLKKATNDIEMI